ncbi:hypothetical protein Sliba_44660 [Streptomyces nigrescens]|uniref:Uncharacterized protein n=1 Tax=Streptomyces nigrescens TaxID=1920 RepID=A0A640TJG6_STRNI|nr:hypothetical protein Sliba_44660 [Streptomyces libani subsp. libani]GGV99616.1 hypothetical protein GCM10010500_50780 [Streptomyces libani subsp. libani]
MTHSFLLWDWKGISLTLCREVPCFPDRWRVDGMTPRLPPGPSAGIPVGRKLGVPVPHRPAGSARPAVRRARVDQMSGSAT